MLEDKQISKPTYKVKLINIACSSSEVLNSLIEDIAQSANPEEGLKSLELEGFSEKSILECWSIS